MDFLLANSLSPVMWRTLGLLLFGNIAIGILEGLLLAALLRTPIFRTVLLASLANYLSTWVGFYVILPVEARPTLVHRLFAEPLHHPFLIFCLTFGLAWLISVLIEWPFAKIADQGRWLRSLGAVSLVNTASYLILSALFLDATITLGRDVQVVEASAVVPAEWRTKATIYFLDDRDGALTSMRLDGSERTTIRPLQATDPHDVLTCLPPVETGRATWTVCLDRRYGKREQPLLDVEEETCDAFRIGSDSELVIRGGWMLGAGAKADLRPDGERDWSAKANSNWGVAVTPGSGKEFHVRFDTPLGSWWGRCVTLLPDDLTVFEFGGQICVLSVSTREVAFLARGRGPVVVLEKPRAR